VARDCRRGHPDLIASPVQDGGRSDNRAAVATRSFEVKRPAFPTGRCIGSRLGWRAAWSD